MSGERKEKKEKYIHRWLREHPQIRLYFKREEYEWLKELADKRGVSVKNIILEAVKFIGSVKEFATMYYE